MIHGNDMKLSFFTEDESFPFYIQYGKHDQQMFIHGHEDFSELVIVLGGQATHIVDKEEFTISKGDVFVMNQGVHHGYDKAEDLKICNIMFRPENLIGESYDIKMLPGYHALFLLEPQYNIEKGFKSRLKLDPVSFTEIESLIKSAINEFESNSPARKTMVRSYFLQLIVLLSRLYGSKVKHKEIEMKPMSEEEAIMQLELLGHEFFVYKDIKQDCVCIIYKRKDGDYGIIETK